MSRLLSLLAIAVPAILSGAAVAKGQLDTSFGSDGTVIEDFGGLFQYDNTTFKHAHAKALVYHQETDTLRVFSDVGFQLNANAVVGAGQTRRFGDGSLDESFEDAGYTVDVWPGGLDSLIPHDAVLDAQTQHLFVGIAWPDVGTGHGVVCRVTVAGNLNQQFGDGGCRDSGQVLAPDQTSTADVIVNGEGNLFYVGGTSRRANNDEVATVTKLDLPFGALYGDYGTLGVVELAPGGTTAAAVRDLAMQDGKLLVLGDYRYPGGNDRDLFLARLHPDGSLDTSFGLQNTGYRPIPVDLGGTNNGFARSLLRRADGTLVVSGIATIDANGGLGIVAIKLDADGKFIDHDWGTSNTGFLTLSDVHRRSHAVDMVEIADGSVLVAAYTDDPILGIDPALLALTQDGQPDPAFGASGRVLLPIDRVDGNATGVDTISRMAYDAGRNRILLAGRSSDPDGLTSSSLILALRLDDDLFADGFEAD